MFKATSMGAVEGMRGYVLTGSGNLRRFLIDHLDTVQLAAASGMPTCDVMVSEDARGAHLQALVRVPNRYCREERIEKALSYEQWSSAMNGDFTFLYEELTQASLRLLTGVPNFYHTRITQYKSFTCTPLPRKCAPYCATAALPTASARRRGCRRWRSCSAATTFA